MPIISPFPRLPSTNLKVQIQGLYRQTVGKDWSSQGRAEADVFHYLHFPIRGRACIHHKGIGYHLNPNRAFWLWGFVPVVREAAEDYDHVFVRFRIESIHGMDPLIESSNGRPLDLGEFDFERWSRPFRDSPSRLLLGLQSLIFGWISRYVPDLDSLLANHHARFAKFPDFFSSIEENLGADLNIQDLALTEGKKLIAFTNSFRRHFGFSPKDYLNRRLFREACSLLTVTDVKVREVAKKLRFNDEYYFNRFFKKMAGCSPGDYRKQKP